MRVPGKLGQFQLQVPCERGGQIQAAICDGGQRADRSAKLKHQNLLVRMAQAFVAPQCTKAAAFKSDLATSPVKALTIGMATLPESAAERASDSTSNNSAWH